MMTVTKKYRSGKISQEKLEAISFQLLNRIEEIFDEFNVQYTRRNNFYQGPCPIHDGDNVTAFSMYNIQGRIPGCWSCWTHHCEKQYKNTTLGFLRGLLSKKHGVLISFDETVDFALDFLKTNIKDIKVNNNHEYKQIIVNNGKFDREFKKTYNTTRFDIRKRLIIPAQYYLNRGYSKEVLDKYDVGLCNNKSKSMYNRIVVPIYDDEHKYYLGCTGRSIYEQCPLCKSHHNPKLSCPNYYSPKWIHSKNLEREKILYNFWYAKDYIAKSKKLILTESPGNVWRFEEAGIHNSLALFGTVLNDKQRIVIDYSGATTLVLCFDNDENGAGKKAAQTIREKYERQYNIIDVTPIKNDVGEMTTEEVKNEYAIFGR